MMSSNIQPRSPDRNQVGLVGGVLDVCRIHLTWNRFAKNGPLFTKMRSGTSQPSRIISPFHAHESLKESFGRIIRKMCLENFQTDMNDVSFHLLTRAIINTR